MQALALDVSPGGPERARTMTRTLLTLTLAASAALAGCNREGNTIVAGGKDEANVTNAADVVMPPSITASKTYRCKDNSLIYIDWRSDGTAKVKKSKDDYSAPAVQPGGEGSPLKGAATDASITYEGKSCKA